MPLRTNMAYARMFGTGVLLTPEDAQGRALSPAETPQARAARGETFSLEFTLPAAGGTRRWYEANGQPLPDHGAARYHSKNSGAVYWGHKVSVP